MGIRIIIFTVLFLCSGCAAMKRDIAQSYFSDGQIYYNAKKYDDARSYFNKALEMDPNFVQAYLMLSTIDIRKGRYDSAMHYAEQCLRVDEDFTPCMMDRAFAFFSLNQYAAAIEQLKKLLAPEPQKDYLSKINNLYALNFIGLSYYGMHDAVNALSYFDQCRKIRDPNLLEFKGIISECEKMYRKVSSEQHKLDRRSGNKTGTEPSILYPAREVPIPAQQTLPLLELINGQKPKFHDDSRSVEY